MKKSLLALCCVCATSAWAEPEITLPWDEFSNLYENQLRQRWMPETETVQAVSWLQADYQIHAYEQHAEIRLRLSGQGKQLGSMQQLFGPELAVLQIESLENIALSGADDGYYVTASADGPVELTLIAAVPIDDEKNLARLHFHLPTAVQNQLQVELSSYWRGFSGPGITDADNRIYFGPQDELLVQLQPANLPAQRPYVHQISELEVQGNELRLRCHFVLQQPISAPLSVHLPPGWQIIHSDLPTSRWQQLNQQLTVDADITQTVFSFELATAADNAELSLPWIDDNRGQQGILLLRDSVANAIEVTGPTLRRMLPVSNAPTALQSFINGIEHYYQATSNQTLSINVKRLTRISAAKQVLKNLGYYVTVAESGRRLTTLQVALPADHSQRALVIKAVANAEIWAVRVNGDAVELLGEANGEWVVPLTEPMLDQQIELSYLQPGEPLALQGRVPIELPATGLSARELQVAIALPDRVELIASEGQLQPAAHIQGGLPDGFSASASTFTHDFYRGEPLSAAIYYREPLED